MFESRGWTVLLWIWIVGLSFCSSSSENDELTYWNMAVKVWEVDIGSNGAPGLNNGIVSSDDDDRIFVTSTKGMLTALQKTNGKIGEKGYTILPTKPPSGWTVECTSSPNLYTSVNATNFRSFVIYAYFVIPPDSTNKQPYSEVVIVHHNKNGIGAESKTETTPQLKGQVIGTPVISSDGAYIYVTHNLPADVNSGKKAEAFFTMLSSETGTILFQESATKTWNIDQQFGPIGMAPNPVQGFYDGGEKNTNDLLVWGPYPPDKYTYNLPGDGGYIFGFQLPSNFSKDQPNYSSFATLRLANVQWTTTTPPTFSKSGQEMFFSASYGSVVAWTQGQEFDDSKQWHRTDLKHDLTIRDEPIFSPPTLVRDQRSNSRILLSTTVSSSTYYGFDPRTGKTVWTIPNLSSIVYTSPPFVDDASSLSYAFLIESNGIIRKIDPFTGDTKWKYTSNNANDGALLLSTATLGNRNQLLYVGDTNGKILAVQIASLPPTISPRPTTDINKSPTPTATPAFNPITIRSSSVKNPHPLSDKPNHYKYGRYFFVATINLYLML